MRRVSEIYIDFNDDTEEGVVFLGDDLTPTEVANSFREFADFLQSLDVNRTEGLVLGYACYDEGKVFAGWGEEERRCN